MSPMIACAPTISPPAPIPCSARKPISSPIDWLSPASIEPARKIRIAARNSGLAPVHVPELPVERRRDGRGEQVRGHDPGEMVEAAEVADDRRQRGRHDRLVERGQEHAEHQRHEHRPQRAAGQPAVFAARSTLAASCARSSCALRQRRPWQRSRRARPETVEQEAEVPPPVAGRDALASPRSPGRPSRTRAARPRP